MAIRWMTVFWDLPAETFEAGTEFWLRITDATLSARRGSDDEFATLIPPQGDPCLRVQRIRSGEGGHHLDLHVDDKAETARRAMSLGATLHSGDNEMRVFHSPGGFTFCLVDHHGESRVPEAIEWPAGQTSTVDQLCIDVRAADFERERDFWAALTERPLVPTRRSEFRRLERPAGAPFEILIQRLDEAEPDRQVKAHLDLACSDVDLETERHLEFGARALGRFEHWQVMLDPAGFEYCITDRVPG